MAFISKNGAKVQKIVIPHCFFCKKKLIYGFIRLLLSAQVQFLWQKP